MTMLIKKRKVVNWDENVFNYIHERYKVLAGREIRFACYNEGRQKLLRGICLIKRSKNNGLLRTSYVLRKTIFNYHFFVDFPFYMLLVSDYELVSFSYSRKVRSSRLLKSRLLI